MNIINNNMGDEETATEVDNEVNVEDSDDDYDSDSEEEDWSFLDEDVLHRLIQNDHKVTALEINHDTFEEYADDDEFDIEDIDWERNGKVFTSTNLKALNIHGDSTETDANKEELYRAVSRNRSIKNLYLDGQHFDIGRMSKLLSPFFIHNRNLRKLKIEGINLSANNSNHLADVFSKCKSLRNIMLGMNREYDYGLKDVLVSKLIANLSDTNIRKLNLSMNTNKAKTKWCRALGNLLQNKSKLTVLDIGYNNINYEGAVALGDGLAGYT